MILVVDDAGARCYLGGIPSLHRRDRVGSVIRYTVVLECSTSERSLCSEDIINFVNAFLEVAVGDPSSRMSRSLDQHFDESSVELLMRSPHGEAVAAELNERMNRVQVDLRTSTPPFETGTVTTPANSWAGLLLSNIARNAFLKSARELLDSRTPTSGLAGYLNLLGGAEEVRHFLERYSSVFMLCDNVTGQNVDLLKPLVAKLGRPVPANSRHATSKIRWFGGATLLAAIFFLLYWAAQQHFPFSSAPAVRTLPAVG